ncbi:MAG: serine/threonine-protein phosphatase [bacterium]|nr:serine/threonine-protein phosphatase [bacterium]
MKKKIKESIEFIFKRKVDSFIEKLFPSGKLTITRDEFEIIFEHEYQRFLEKMGEKDKLLKEQEEEIHDWEVEHSNSLALQFDNERQKNELKILNKQLRTNDEIYKRDMLMARKVQESLLFNKPPNTNNFDLAFYYEPLVSVSGDFYDLYLDKSGDLLGLTLADVSGHGIASGLLTTLAKPIFNNIFRNHLETSLGKVMNMVNNQLIEAKGGEENYLTGIILRYKDDMIEYVNAAHPDIIMKNSKTNKSKFIKAKDELVQGTILGIDGIGYDFKSYKFKIETDDVLVIYSDCLYENLNYNGEEYGQERILLSLDKISPDAGAQEILDTIVADFKYFNGSIPLTDDLTMVVIKKK